MPLPPSSTSSHSLPNPNMPVLLPIVLQMIVQYGIPGAIQIWGIVSKNFADNEKPTQEMWDNLILVENARHAKFLADLSSIPPVPA